MRIFLLPVLVVALVGCQQSSAPTPAPTPPQQKNGPSVATTKPDPVLKPSVQTDEFALSLVAEESYKKNADGQLLLQLQGRSGWHVNMDFPFKVEMNEVKGLGIGKTVMTKDDAAEFNDEKVTAKIPIKALEEGEHQVQCSVSFAMCTDTNCVPDKRELALNVRVVP